MKARRFSAVSGHSFLRWLLRGCALILCLSVGGLLAFLLFRGLPALGTRLFFGDVPALEALRARPVWWG